MSDILIQDNALKGSPILSYGQSGPKRVWSGLFGLIFAVLVSLVVLLGILFWCFTKVPVPGDAVVLVILPRNAQLPSTAPDSWLEAVNRSKFLPTLVGYAHDQGQAPQAFSVRAPNILDIKFLKTGKWQMAGQINGSVSYKTPISLFRWPFGRSKVWLSIDLKKFLSVSGVNFANLPEKLSGYADEGVWQTGLKADDQFSFSQRNAETGGFAPVKPETSGYIKNAFASQGISLDLPESGVLYWHKNQFARDYEFVSLAQMSQSTKIALLEAKDVFDTADYVLPDKDVVKTHLPPTASFASNTQYFADNGFKFSLPDANADILNVNSSSNSVSGCRGQIMAVFDKPAIENICSWLGFCAVKPEKLIITDVGGKVNFCYTGL